METKTERKTQPPACPNCGHDALVAEDQVVHLQQILNRWKEEAKVTFSDQVRQEYSDVIATPLTLHSCANCGLKQFRPVIVGSEAFYADISEIEDDYYVSDRWEFDRAVKDLLRYRCRSVLDVGCGSGAFLAKVAGLPSMEAYGYEFNPRAAELAKGRGHRLLTALDRETALPGGFDAVCMFQILEHLADPFAVLEEVGALLKPGGLLIITVPDNAGPVQHFHNSLTDLPPHHVTRWRRESLEELARRRGFAVLGFAFEPLPHYLWDSYVPMILTRDLRPIVLRKVFHRREIANITNMILKMLKRMGIRHLRGVRGHTLYALLRRRNGVGRCM